MAGALSDPTAWSRTLEERLPQAFEGALAAQAASARQQQALNAQTLAAIQRHGQGGPNMSGLALAAGLLSGTRSGSSAEGWGKAAENVMGVTSREKEAELDRLMKVHQLNAANARLSGELGSAPFGMLQQGLSAAQTLEGLRENREGNELLRRKYGVGSGGGGSVPPVANDMTPEARASLASQVGEEAANSSYATPRSAETTARGAAMTNGKPSLPQVAQAAQAGAPAVAAPVNSLAARLQALHGQMQDEELRYLVARGNPKAKAMMADLKAEFDRTDKLLKETPEYMAQSQRAKTTAEMEVKEPYERAKAEREAGRLSDTTIKDLGKAGEEFAGMRHIVGGFDDKYGGYGIMGLGGETIGNLANAYGRKHPMATAEDKARASWWQEYQRRKNVVRNELFGSALTPGEQEEFAKADINPGMQSDVIRKNLARQQEIINRGAKRIIELRLQRGADPKEIELAFGAQLKQLGVDPSRYGRNAPASSGTSPQFKIIGVR